MKKLLFLLAITVLCSSCFNNAKIRFADGNHEFETIDQKEIIYDVGDTILVTKMMFGNWGISNDQTYEVGPHSYFNRKDSTTTYWQNRKAVILKKW